MQLLLKHGLDPNERGIRRETPLHQASRQDKDYRANLNPSVVYLGRQTKATQEGYLTGNSAALLLKQVPHPPHLTHFLISLTCYGLLLPQTWARGSCRASVATRSGRECKRGMGRSNSSPLRLSIGIPQGSYAARGSA